MASIKIRKSAGTYDIEVDWDYEALRSSIRRLLEAKGSPPFGLKIVGRRTQEYEAGLDAALKDLTPLHFWRLADVKAHVIRNARASNAEIADVMALFESMSDWAFDRYNVSSRNGSLWQWSLPEICAHVFAHEGAGMADSRRLARALEIVAETVVGRVVIAGQGVITSSNLSVVFPYLVREAPEVIWILADENRVFQHVRLPEIQRDYLEYSELVEALSSILNITNARAQALTRRHRSSRYVYDNQDVSMTRAGFDQRLSFYLELAEKENLDEIPIVPQPSPAPIQFGIIGGKLGLADVQGDMPSSSEVIQEILRELVDLADDAIDRHNLSNVAPVLASKVNRLKAKFEGLLDEGLSEARIISVGVLSSALAEALQAEGDDLFPSAMGALNGLATQAGMFVNRFNAWREYVRSAGSLDEYANPESIAPAFATLKLIVETPSVLEERAKTRVEDLLVQVKESSTVEERKGVIATIQNLIAVAATFAKEVVVRGSVLAGKIIEKVVVNQAAHAVVLFVIGAQPQLQILADRYPHVFWWLPSFLEWLKDSVDLGG